MGRGSWCGRFKDISQVGLCCKLHPCINVLCRRSKQRPASASAAVGDRSVPIKRSSNKANASQLKDLTADEAARLDREIELRVGAGGETDDSKLAPQLLLLLWLKGAAMLTRCACVSAGWTVSARQVPDAVPRHQVQHCDGGHGAQCGAQPGTAGLDDGADGRHAQGAGADACRRARVRGPDFSC